MSGSHTDGDAWAKPVERLAVTGVEPGGAGINVAGKRPTSPVQGFGRMWQKTYRVRLAGSEATPAEVIAVWKRDFPNFWPKGNRFFAPLAGIAPGEVAVLDLSMPGRIKLSTGVLVMYADEESFTLMTPQGHMFAGWITFSAHLEDGVTVAQAQVLMRASDPLYEVGMTMGGHRQEDRHWEHRRRKWGNAGNVWHNAGIRSGVYSAAAPIRFATRPFRRGRD
jgi:hypothetical protein